MNNEDNLSGGDVALENDANAPCIQKPSPPTQLREIAEKWAAKKWSPPKGEEHEYDNNLWYVETSATNDTNCARGLSERDAKEIVYAHNESLIRAMQEAWEIGYKFACEADNAQFKYGYKKGLA